MEIPGFYDNPNFMAIEMRDPEFLNCYASFVKKQHYTEEYIAKSKGIIRLVMSHLNSELVKEKSTGRCVEVSMIISRILEKFGVWNFIVKGSLTVSLPEKYKIPNQYHWSVSKSAYFDAGHAWVVAPPFTVIDLTVKHQPYTYNAASYMPDFILADNIQKDKLVPEDIIEPELLIIPRLRRLSNAAIFKQFIPKLVDFSKVFEPERLRVDDVDFKYTPVAIGAPDMYLEDLPKSINKKLAIDLYNEIAKKQ